MKKIIITVSIIMLAAAGIVWYYLERNKYKPPTWKTCRVDTGSVAVKVTATGSLSAVRTVQVGAQVSGIVARLFVDFDSVVKSGQVIALLDTTLLSSALRDADALVTKAHVQVDLTRKQFTRADTLFRQSVASQADFDLAYSNFKAAEAELKAAEASLQHERTNLKYATIRAPINGTVISRNVDVGQTVISSFNAPTLFTIAHDLTQMQVLANVDEADIGQIATGQETSFTVDAYPYDVFKGVVAQIRLQPVVVQNVNNYIVVINVANPDLKLLPGLTANVTIRIQEHAHVLRAPITALHFSPPSDYLQHAGYTDSMIARVQSKRIAGNDIPRPGDRCYIWLKRDDKLSPVEVQTGLFDGTYIEFTGDIRQGEELITGAENTQTGATTTNNPFMPKMPPRRTMR